MGRAQQPHEESGYTPKETYQPSVPTPIVARPRLSKRQKKKLLEAHLSATSGMGQRTAVIIGAGPGGLAAAITLAQLGMKVTVLEARANESGDKPAHSRPHQISLRQDSLIMLKKLGVYDEVMEKSGFVKRELHLTTDGQDDHQVSSSKPWGVAQDHTRSFLDPTMLMTDSVSQVRISDLEKALLSQAEKLGIEIKCGVSAELARSENGASYGVSIRNVKKDGDGYSPYGESSSLGTPDLVVAADGAGSPTRLALGIDVLEESPLKHYLGGHIQIGTQGETRKATLTESNGMVRHIMGTGHAQYDATWVSVEISPEEAKLSPSERAELLADKAGWVMGTELSPEDIGWGAGQVTTVQNRRAETTTAGDNVVLLGDAAGSGSVWVGGGLNLALTTHLSSLTNLALRITADKDRTTALHIYDRSIQWATSAWHKAGAQELGVKGDPAKEML